MSCLLRLLVVTILLVCASNAAGWCVCACTCLLLSAHVYTVTLNSSADSLCPGDGVVFTCVTETSNSMGRLVWDINHQIQSYHSEAQLNGYANKDIFTTVLHNFIQNHHSTILYSTATANNVSISDKGKVVECSDGSMTKVQKTINFGMFIQLHGLLHYT